MNVVPGQLSERDRGYEHRYGIAPEAPFPTTTAEGEPSIEPIPAEKFEQLWQQGRQARERLHGNPHE